MIIRKPALMSVSLLRIGSRTYGYGVAFIGHVCNTDMGLVRTDTDFPPPILYIWPPIDDALRIMGVSISTVTS